MKPRLAGGAKYYLLRIVFENEALAIRSRTCYTPLDTLIISGKIAGKMQKMRQMYIKRAESVV